MNNLNGYLPVPTSILRKDNGKRLSMASATRLSLIGSSLLPRGNLIESISSIPTIKRRSLISTPSTRRQSSTSRVPSSNLRVPSSNLRAPSSSRNRVSGSNLNPNASDGIYSQLSVFNTIHHDSRPIRDKQYQNLIQGEVHEFLRINKFEIEMNHPLTSKTLKQPTQKDFIMIFQFLYNKIDPYYKFTRSIEIEVFNILRLLNYPYLDGINRSQISAVGGGHWPNFLAMLYWLVKLNLQLSEIDMNETLAKSFDDQLSDLCDDYIKKSFISYARLNNDEFDEYLQEFKGNLDQFLELVDTEITKKIESNNQLKLLSNEVNDQLKVYENAEKKSKALENDLIKFKAYIETVESRKSEWDNILADIDKEVEKYRETSNSMNQEIQDLELSLKSKGLDIDTINKLTNDRSELSKQIDIVNDKIDESNDQLRHKQVSLRNNFESLDNFIKNYNNLIYKIQYKQLSDHNFEIKLSDQIWDPSIEFKPQDILDKNLKDEKVELLKFKTDINLKIHSIEDQKIKVQEQTDLMNEKIAEQKDELESLSSKLTIDRLTYDQLYTQVSDKATTFSTKIEKLGREIHLLKADANREYLTVLQKYNDVVVEGKTLDGVLYRKKNNLHNQIQDIIETTINFKLGVQLNLQDLEELVLRELETDQLD